MVGYPLPFVMKTCLESLTEEAKNVDNCMAKEIKEVYQKMNKNKNSYGFISDSTNVMR